jgi:hypothetical protein
LTQKCDHFCKQCEAYWAQDPVYEAARWSLTIEPTQLQREQEELARTSPLPPSQVVTQPQITVESGEQKVKLRVN